MFGFGKKKDQAQIQAENEKNEKSLVSGEPVRFGGFNGDRLLTAIVFTATVGFSLFGYDQGKPSFTFWRIRIQAKLPRFDVRYHRFRTIQPRVPSNQAGPGSWW
jgi:hypothetical protein